MLHPFTTELGESLQITHQMHFVTYFWKFSTNVQENKKERERSSVSNPFEREALQPSTTERGESCKAMVIEVTQQLK